MNCPTLADLPAPPSGRTGWPWTTASVVSAETMPDGSPWPRISIVTPSYNQGQFIEETIRSVLLQGYPDLEYIVMDGGSTDGTVDVIGKYEPWLAHWVSERDKGQAEAINKGWAGSTGPVVAWLNSDDMLLPGAMEVAVCALAGSPDAGAVYGDVWHIDKLSRTIGSRQGLPFALDYVLTRWHNVSPQPGLFLTSEAFRSTGFLDESLSFVMDLDYWLRMALEGWNLIHVPRYLASARLHAGAKTSGMPLVAAKEQVLICDRVLADARLPDSLRSQERLIRSANRRAAAYWAYLSGRARETREYARQALALTGYRDCPSWGLWLASLFGDRGMLWLRELRRAMRGRAAAV